MTASTLIIDYGMGNLRSVVNAFKAIGGEVHVSSNPQDLTLAERIVLPGVGAFADAMHQLRTQGFIESLNREVLQKGKPFLGLCLGLQLLATLSTEHGIHHGLNWIPGRVEKIKPTASEIRIPHIGWNDVRFSKKNSLYAGLGESKTFYFVHSYVLRPQDPDVVSATCVHGNEFVASIEKDNIFATQFHPEKSQQSGLMVLKNFLTWIP